MRLLWLRCRAFVHATEDEARVRDALLWTIGRLGDPRAGDRVERRRTKGYYGNEILLLEAALTREPDVRAALDRLLGEPGLRAAVRASLARRVDEDGVLHVRLDKQGAVERRLALADRADAYVVRVKRAGRPSDAATAWGEYAAALEPRVPGASVA